MTRTSANPTGTGKSLQLKPFLDGQAIIVARGIAFIPATNYDSRFSDGGYYFAIVT
jgi:hypothetical protein